MRRPAAGWIAYQTEPRSSEHEPGSSASSVESRVVPLTPAGSASGCAAARWSLGGGAASAGAGAPRRVPGGLPRGSSASRGPYARESPGQSERQSSDGLVLEPVHGRALEDVALGAEARAVAGAVPAALGGVPVDLAAEVGADRRDRDERAVVAAVAGDLLAAVADDVALAGREVLDRAACRGA